MTGFGSKRFKIIINEYPNILNITVTEGMITKLPGFQTKIATQFINGLDDFKMFIKDLPMLKIYIPNNNNIEQTGNIFKEQHLVLTGFTDKEIEKFIIDNGGSIQGSVNTKTNLLITKNKDSNTSKFKKALELDIRVLTKEEFIHNYLN